MEADPQARHVSLTSRRKGVSNISEADVASTEDWYELPNSTGTSAADYCARRTHEDFKVEPG